MADLYDLVEEQRDEILESDRLQAAAIIAIYALIWSQAQASLSRLNQQIQEAKARGEKIDQAWMLQRDRLATIQAQVEATVTQYAQSQIYPIITNGQVAAITMAERHAQTSILASLGATAQQAAQLGIRVTPLPIGAMNAMVGRLADGSPLSRLLGELGPEASNAIKGVLLKGVAQGYNPRRVAREMRKSLGGNMSRALRISRNEQLRAYREASLEAYRQNEQLVHGWLWIASLSPRTCPLCIAEHGSFHPLTEPFASHISCRCSPVPWTKSFAELGIEGVPDTGPPLPESGESWFARQSPQYQESLLGPGKYEAYRAGQIRLSDLVGHRDDPNWGPSRYVKSLDSALAR